MIMSEEIPEACMEYAEHESKHNKYHVFSDIDLEYYELNPFLQLIQICQKEHPLISIDRGIFGGIPHIQDLRLSVGDILAQLYLLGSINAVQNYFAPHLSEEQVKEAIAFAQDFLESACESYQSESH